MDDSIKKQLEDMYVTTCIALTELGYVAPVFYLVKDETYTPVILEQGLVLEFSQYATMTVNAANEQKCEAIVLISIQYMVEGYKDDQMLQDIVDGKIDPSDHISKKEYLVLAHMGNKGSTDVLFGEIKIDPGGTKYVASQNWAQEATNSMMGEWKGSVDGS